MRNVPAECVPSDTVVSLAVPLPFFATPSHWPTVDRYRTPTNCVLSVERTLPVVELDQPDQASTLLVLLRSTLVAQTIPTGGS